MCQPHIPTPLAHSETSAVALSKSGSCRARTFLGYPFGLGLPLYAPQHPHVRFSSLSSSPLLLRSDYRQLAQQLIDPVREHYPGIVWTVDLVLVHGSDKLF